MTYTHLESPCGRLLLAGDDAGLRWISFPGGKKTREPEAGWRAERGPFEEAIRQLRAYFAGELRDFNLTLAPQGTPFQLGVWRALRDIPYATTISYGELARRVGTPNGSRAVGLANGSNPLPIVIPCHRVIGSNGKLTGYGGGMDNKERLLSLERGQASLLRAAAGE